MLAEPIPCSKMRCKHYRGIVQPDGTEATERDICTAFPDGIPGEITTGENLHVEPFPGDNGIQYEAEKPKGLVNPTIKSLQRKHFPTVKISHPDQWIDNEADIIATLQRMPKEKVLEWVALQGIMWVSTKPAAIREVQKMIGALARSRQQTNF